MRSGRPHACTHQLRIVFGGSGAFECRWSKQEEEAEEVGVSGPCGEEGDLPGAPEAQCPGGCRASLFVRVVRWPPPCAWLQALRRRRAGAPHAPWPGAGARRGQASRFGGPAGPARPAPAVWPPPPAAALSPAHLPLRAPGRDPRGAPSGSLGHPAAASSRRRTDLFLFLTHGFRKHVLKFSSRI